MNHINQNIVKSARNNNKYNPKENKQYETLSKNETNTKKSGDFIENNENENPIQTNNNEYQESNGNLASEGNLLSIVKNNTEQNFNIRENNGNNNDDESFHNRKSSLHIFAD